MTPARPSPPTPQWASLKLELEHLLDTTDKLAERDNDPVSFVHAYDHREDQEVVALIAACLAYGQVKLLKRAIAQVLAALGPHPAERLRHANLQEERDALDGFVYRMTQAPDVLGLLRAIGETLRQEGNLEALFCLNLNPDASDYQAELAAFVHTLRERSGAAHRRGLRYLLPDAASGSANKRLCLFLRWMVRGPDGIDLGLWRRLDTARLTMPLDTHIQRLSTYLGLTQRKSPNWKMAREITMNLARLHPKDPLRYDFALCHMGISGQCPRRRDDAVCAQCPIQSVCLL